MKSIRTLIFTILSLVILGSGSAFAQSLVKVSGVVTSAEDDLPMIGVGVLAGPGVGVTTSIDGDYTIEGMDRMSKDDYMTVHGGYDRQFVLEDPNLVIPLDVLRKMEKDGEFGELLPYFSSTTGTGTATNSAARFGDDIGKKFVEEGVDAVILTST